MSILEGPKDERRSRGNTVREYVRDGRSPIPNSPVTSIVMSANRARNTGPELALRRALWRFGVRGYRLHPRGIPGRPDISFTKQRVAVFVHGCFWHRCPNCNPPLPKSHKRFWSAKFSRNKRRDQEKLRDLTLAGWESVVVWECEVRKNPSRCVRRIIRVLHVTSSLPFQGRGYRPEPL